MVGAIQEAGKRMLKGDEAGNSPCQPSYVSLYRSGELARRAERAWAMLESCCLCPHECGVNRLAGQVGVCRSSAELKVASWTLHPWEEPPISGSCGSGTIFFSGCMGRCRFCQNFPISQLGAGNVVSVERLAEMMVELESRGAHNINLVTPTHFVPHILAALLCAVKDGLRLPVVYNTSGYESVETLRLLDGIVSVYLPDAKYADDAIARRLSGFPRYVEVNRAALREMYRQVGKDLVLDNNGLARRGLIVRHMVLPEGLSGTSDVLAWIAAELSPYVHVSLMDQYFPAYRAVGDPILGRKVTFEEYLGALEAFDAAELERGWRQFHQDETHFT